MTLRLSTLFETHIRPILSGWNKPAKRSRNRRGATEAGGQEGQPGPSTLRSGGVDRPGPSNSRPRRSTAGNGVRRLLSSSDDEEDDGNRRRNGTDQPEGRRQQRPAPSTSSSATTTRHGSRAMAGNSSSSQGNGVSSSSMAGPSASSYQSRRREAMEGPSSSSSMSTRPRRGLHSVENGHGRSNGGTGEETRTLRRRVQRIADDDEEEDEEVNGHNTEDSSESSSASSDSDGSNGIPLAELGNSRRLARQYDSEDSYRPSGTATRKGPSRKKKKKSSNKSSRRASKRQSPPVAESEHSDDDSEVLVRGARKRTRPSRGSPVVEEPVASTSRRENLRSRGSATTTVNGRDRTRGSDSDGMSSDDPLSRRKRARYESDQSFQLEATRSTRRTRVVESESVDEEFVRPTRSSKRRADLAWANDEDEEDEAEQEEQEEDDEDEAPEEVERSSRRSAAASTVELTSSQRRSVS